MKGSTYAKPCQGEVDAWYQKLDQVNRTFQAWGNVQTNWLYLLPIFSSKDIVAQMPEEGKLFTKIDGTFRKYMKVRIISFMSNKRQHRNNLPCSF